ncbi:MAG: hypothetical protein AB7N91_18360 [Candidatus Tectimicrobiota bacterium]
MMEAGMLSIVRRGHPYQIRYASSNPYDLERPPYWCPTESALVALLHSWGVDPWALQQAVTTLARGRVAVLPVRLSATQQRGYFPVPHAVPDGRSTEDMVSPQATVSA